MTDSFDFSVGGTLLARLHGAEKLGQFTAFTSMQVTAAGRRRGYFDLLCGQLVNTPHARQQGPERVQMPWREGICCRILVGSSATGSKKSSATQQNLLILSFVEKVSRFAPTVTDPLGLYKMSSKAYICEIEREWDREFPTIPPWPIDPWAIKKPMADEPTSRS